MGSFDRSWRLLRESASVLRSQPQMLWLPLISGLLTTLLFVAIILPVGLSGKLDQVNRLQSDPLYYLGAFAFYLATSFIVIFFNSALVTCAYAQLNGQRASLSDGLRHSVRHVGQILAWAFIAATFGVILRAISERAGLVGKLVIALLGAAWSLLTYFVVPLMVVNNLGPISALKQSSAMLKRTWGENLSGQVGIGAALLVATMLGFIPLTIGFMIGTAPSMLFGLGLAVFWWIAISIIGAALSGIFQTALYIYATTGAVPSAFSSELVAGAFSTKKRAWTSW